MSSPIHLSTIEIENAKNIPPQFDGSPRTQRTKTICTATKFINKSLSMAFPKNCRIVFIESSLILFLNFSLLNFDIRFISSMIYKNQFRYLIWFVDFFHFYFKSGSSSISQAALVFHVENDRGRWQNVCSFEQHSPLNAMKYGKKELLMNVLPKCDKCLRYQLTILTSN